RVIPRLSMDLMEKYLRLRVEGVENIPREGPALICPNHSGYSGLDALMLANLISKQTGRVPRILAHHLWFITRFSASTARKLGFVEATSANGIKYLSKKQIVVLFPEGEYGNFKPTTQAYHLQEFKRGFVRMALQTQSPIVPCIVIGAEETHINLSRLQLPPFLGNLTLPLPLNLLPLPAKWKIKFLKPMTLPYGKETVEDTPLVHSLSAGIQERMQKAINQELSKRRTIFI
ncbi:MAG: acyltransferase family protein, partial [Bdellovibrionales bacterium]|nr:acyltransferase family protein [Bdellovibrionales bacterium]